MNEAQYGEPWRLSEPHGKYIMDNAGAYLPNEMAGKHGARIVACVNACAGIPHPERLPALLAAIRQPDGTCEDVLRAITAAHAALYEE